MADEVGSLSVSVGLDVVAFNRGIKELSQKMKILGAEFKNSSAGLDKVGDAAQISRNKITLLTGKIGEQRQLVDQLKTAHANAAEQFGEGSRQAQAYELRLVRAEGALQGMERELASTTRELAIQESSWTQLGNTLNDVGRRMQRIGDGMQDVGKKMSTSITAPILAMGAAAVAAFKDVDNGMDIVIKKTGATGETAKELEKIYKDIASSVPDSMDEVGSAVGELNTRFEFTGDTLKKASEDFLKFARINDMDVNSSIQLVSRAMGDAGIESSEYGSVLDMLTVAAQKSGISMDSLTENLTKYGAPMRALGIDTETSIAMFAGWEKAGVTTEIAFSGMKLAIGKWGKAGKDSTVEFEKTLKAIKGAPDITAATGMAIEIFGQRAGADLADAIQGGRFEIGDYVEALKNAGGTVESTYGGITDGTDDAKIAFNQIKVSASELGDVIITTLVPFLKSLGEKIKEIGEWFSGLSPEMKKTVLAIAGIAAAIGPVLVIVGTLSTAVGAIAGVFAAASLALGGATAATLAEGVAAGTTTPAVAALAGAFNLLTWPITLAVAAIVAIIAIGVLLYKNWDTIKAKVIELKEMFVNTFPKFTAVIKAEWDAIKAVTVAIWKTISAEVIAIWETIKLIFTTGFLVIKDIITGNWGDIGNVFHTAGEKLHQIVGDMLSKIKATWQNAFDAIKIYVVTAWETIKTKTIEKLDEWWTAMGTWFSSIPAKITTQLGEWWIAIGKWYDDTKKKIGEKLDEWWTAMGTWFSSIPAKITVKLGEWKTALVKWTTEQNEENKRQLNEWWTAIETWFTGIPAKITLKLGEWKKALVLWYDETKKDIITKLGEWWTDMGKWYDDTKKKIGEKLDEWGGSIGKWYDDTRTNIPIKLAEWWDRMGKWYDETKKNIIKKLGEWWDSIGKWFSDTGEKSIKNLTDGTNKQKQSFMDNLGKIIVDGIKGAFAIAVVVIVAVGIELLKRLIKTVKGLAGDVKKAFVFVVDTGIDYLKNIDLIQIGKDIINGLIQGVKNKMADLRGSVEEMASSLPGWIKKILGIQSPSTVMQEVGQYMIDGLVVGIGDRAGEVGTAMDGIVSAVSSKASGLMALGTSMGQDFTNSFRNSINYTPPRDGGYTIGPDGTLSGGVGDGSSSHKGSSSPSKSGGTLVDADGDGDIDYKLNEDGSKHHYAYHEGGWVGKALSGLSGLFGNLKFDEVPAILQTGEYVLSRKMIEGITSSGSGSGSSLNDVGSNVTNSSQIINYEGIFKGATINVRNDNDIKLIAKELYSLQRGRSRGQAVTA